MVPRRAGGAVLVMLAAVLVSTPASMGSPDDAGEDRYHSKYPLLMSTYVGGTDVEWGHSVALGPDGSVYVAGYTLSSDFPAAGGAVHLGPGGGEDVFVLRLSSDGRELDWAARMGGSSEDIPWDIAVGKDGRVYVVGLTGSANFPTTLGALSRQLDGPQDAFVACLEADGTSLVYSTLLGGDADDAAYSVVPLEDGTAYVAGETESTFFPTRSGAYDQDLSGYSDVFVARLSGGGANLLSSTLLGGNYTEWEPVIALEEGGPLWVTGSSTSLDFPVTKGAYDGNPNLGRDIFITALRRDLSDVVVSTIMGGPGNDVPRSLDLGGDGRVVVGGFTSSPTFPKPLEGHFYNSSGATDGFVMALDGNITRLVDSHLLGGSSMDVVRTALLGPRGLFRVTGYTNSTDFPTTKGSFEPYKTGEDHDAFYMELDPLGAVGNYSTYIGGRRNGDFGMDMALGTLGLPVVVGHSRDDDFPTRMGGYDTSYNGAGDVVVFRFTADTEPPVVTEDLTQAEARTGEAFSFGLRVFDRSGVALAQVEYWFDEGERLLANMTGGSEPSLTVTVDPSARTMSYHFLLWDPLGELHDTEVVTINVTDSIPPWLVEDITPPSATTGDPLVLSARFQDNIEVAEAHVEYAQGTFSGNASMVPAEYPLGFMEHALAVPSHSLEGLRYSFVFADGNGNWNRTRWSRVVVTDDDPPWFENVSYPASGQLLETIRVEAWPRDNVGLSSVRIEYRLGAGPLETLVESGPIGLKVTFPVGVAADEPTDLVFTLVAKDAAGNEFSVPGIVPISDTSPPRFERLDWPGNATTGDDLLVSWELWDESSIASMTLNHRLGEGDWTRVALTPPAAQGGVSIPVPADSLGPLTFYLEVRDAYTNVNRSAEVTIAVEDDDPPVADAGPDVKAVRGKPVTLDAGASTDNIGVTRYEWSWTAPGTDTREVREGPNPTLTERLPAGRHEVVLTVHDAAGNSATDGVTVTVRDPPGDGVATSTLLLVVGVAVLAALAAFGLLYAGRRRSRP